MNKLFLYGIIVAALCTACATNENAAGSADKNAAEVKPAVNDKVECAKLSDIKMGGYVGEKMDAFFKNRVLSDEAKNKIFEEAEKAFSERIDDESVYVGYWRGEFWGKLAISASGVCEYTGDKNLKNFLSKKAAVLASLQDTDGYLGSYKQKNFLRVNDLDKAREAVGWDCNWCWNLWCRKYTLWGLLEIYKLNKDPAVLETAKRATDQYISMLKSENVKICDTGTFVGMPSMSILKPMLILYRETGDAKYLDFAKELVSYWDRDGNPPPNLLRNAFSAEPVRLWYPQLKNWEKAYEMMSCLEGLAEYHRVTGDKKALDAVVKIREKLLKDEKNILSSVGYNDMFVGGARQINGITEPCDAIHWMRINRELYLLTSDTKYLDEIEDTFYNAFLAGVARDGKWGARCVRSHGSHYIAKPQCKLNYNHCCVDNMPRAFLDFARTSLAKSGGELFVNFYSPYKGKVGNVEVEVLGNYPVSDTAEVKIKSPEEVAVNFRVPSWSKKTLINGKVANADWHKLNIGKGETSIKIEFDMTPRVINSDLSSEYYASGDMRVMRWLGYDEACRKDFLPIMRHSAAATIKKGPLLLARSKYIGNTSAEMFSSPSVNNAGAKCELIPEKPSHTWGQWKAKITADDGKIIETKVCDFASAGDNFKRGSTDMSPTHSVFF